MIVLALLCCVLLAAVFVFVMLWRDAVAERDACQEELECVWKELNTVRLLREQLAERLENIREALENDQG
jgi:hypothetical protein